MPNLARATRFSIFGCLALLALTGLTSAASGTHSPAETGEVPLRITTLALSAPAEPCTDSFVARDLDHTTTVPGDTVDHFEANGAGVAVGDLDNDGDMDVVLANHAGPNTILWNEGRLSFRTQRMQHGDSRAVNIVDVDADGWLDVVFTHRTGGMAWWRNQGQAGGEPGQFRRQVLPGVARPAYAMAWGDLDADGDLDLVTGSYDASLLDDLGNEFLLKGGGGVIVYENRSGAFAPAVLASKAQAMAIALYDVNGDGLRDIVVGNDFAVRDGVWTRTWDGWASAAPFHHTSHSTMGLDVADVDNDGVPELFSSDMKPYANDIPTLAAWRPVMVELWQPLPLGDPQRVENTLQVRRRLDYFHDEAYDRGLDSTGWTWSARFGDLDNDGHLDLYAVNGMIEAELLRYLPNHELVEVNQALRNTGRGRFEPMPQWGLGSTRSGRGMAMADLDSDGDLDIVVNNLRTPAQLFENRLCGGAGLEVDLLWPGTTLPAQPRGFVRGGNTRALGAVVTLHTDTGMATREVRSGGGYLSGDASRLHFGLPGNATPEYLEIRWPDGAVSRVDTLQPNISLTVQR